MTGFNVKTNSYSTGKPHPIHMRKIMEYLDIKAPEKVLFVGDTMYTDIRLAEESGFKSALVLSGNTKGNDEGEPIATYTVDPDYILQDIRGLDTIIKF